MQPQPHGVVVTMQPDADGGSKARGAQVLQVSDHVLWSLFNFVFWNVCCFGFAALVVSIKSRDRKVVGDVEGASMYGRRAKWLNVVALILNIVFLVIVIVLVATQRRHV